MQNDAPVGPISAAVENRIADAVEFLADCAGTPGQREAVARLAEDLKALVDDRRRLAREVYALRARAMFRLAAINHDPEEIETDA